MFIFESGTMPTSTKSQNPTVILTANLGIRKILRLCISGDLSTHELGPNIGPKFSKIDFFSILVLRRSEIIIKWKVFLKTYLHGPIFGFTYVTTVRWYIQRWSNESLICYYSPGDRGNFDCTLDVSWAEDLSRIGGDVQRSSFDPFNLNWACIGSDLAKITLYKIWYFHISIV